MHTAGCNSALISGNMNEYKKAPYALRRAVKESAKQSYRDKLGFQFQQHDIRSTDYKEYTPHMLGANISLAEDLNCMQRFFFVGALRLSTLALVIAIALVKKLKQWNGDCPWKTLLLSQEKIWQESQNISARRAFRRVTIWKTRTE